MKGRVPRGLLASIAVPALAAATLAAIVVQPGGASEPALPAAHTEPVLGRVSLAHIGVSAGSSKRTPTRPARPAWISIPAAGADGPVDSVGQSAGRLEIPPPGRAGWFAPGPRPGEAGRAVIVSHVDSQRGPALFAGLRALPRGARILVHDRRGRVRRFRLERRRQVEKSRFRASSVYGGSARRELVLITCGGPFRPTGGYRDNVILYARAVPRARRQRSGVARGGKGRKRVVPATATFERSRKRLPARVSARRRR